MLDAVWNFSPVVFLPDVRFAGCCLPAFFHPRHLRICLQKHLGQAQQQIKQHIATQTVAKMTNGLERLNVVRGSSSHLCQ